MLLSFDKKILFIHIPKNAGTSVRTVFGPFSIYPERLLFNKVFHYPFAFSERFLHLHVHKRVLLLNTPAGVKFGVLNSDNVQHAKANDIQRILGKPLFESLFKFCFVRNPWAREVSDYEYVKRTIRHPVSHIINSNNWSFQQYLEWKLERKQEQSPQLRFIADIHNNLLVDFVGKVENIEQHFKKIAEITGINPNKLPKLNSTTYACSYQDYYDSKTKKIVEELYQDELDLFEYSF